MKYSIIGDENRVAGLIRVIGACSDHEIVRGPLESRLEMSISQHLAATSKGDSTLTEIAEISADALIIAAASPQSVAIAKGWATAGKPLFVVPEAMQGLALVQELTLIREDTCSLLYPLFVLASDPVVHELRATVDDGVLGDLLDLEFERRICGQVGPLDNGSEVQPREGDNVNGAPDMSNLPSVEQRRTNGAEPRFLSQSDTLRFLPEDVVLLRRIAGEFSRATSMKTGQHGEFFTRATVILGGEDVPEATWTMTLSNDDPGWKLTVTGIHGTAVLRGGEKIDRMTLEFRGDRVDPGSPPPRQHRDVYESILDRFFEAQHDVRLRAKIWLDAVRAFEVLDACERSLRRRRTVELHHETTSERSQFKTQMTALGCMLLSGTLVAVVGLLIFGAVFDAKSLSPAATTFLRIARIAVFAPLGLFLILQFLLFVAKPPRPDR